MRNIKYILVNESYSQDVVLAIRNNSVSDFRHSHVVSGAGLSREELIQLLVFTRKRWPFAKILSLSEINGSNFRPSKLMNSIRRDLSNYP